MQRLRIVLSSACLARYPEGGGHWSAFLQHVWGLAALGHDVFWLEFLRPGDPQRTDHCLRTFASRMDEAGLAGCWALALAATDGPPTFEALDVRGVSKMRLREIIADADLLWDFVCSVRPPILGMFRRSVLIDLDPGIVHVSALDADMALAQHDVRFTAGLNVGAADSDVPLLGLSWISFPQFVHLPAWPVAEPPPDEASFTSVTQWGWGELHLDGRVLSVSKRDAYLHYVDVPQRSGARFELAANIHPSDPTGDLPLLAERGWSVVDPNIVVPDPASYRDYIARSRAEFCCPKPIYRDLRTGWLSDRSVAFLASGRPVVMENTGLDKHLPLGAGLLCFDDVDGATEAVREVEGNYAHHARAARELAEDCLAADRVLPRMLDACSAAVALQYADTKFSLHS